MISLPNSKINLGLRILSKREDGYHNLETVFYPISIKDGLEIIASTNQEEIIFTQSGNTVEGLHENNLCVKAYRLIKKDRPSLPNCKIHLHKKIPEKAGLGGGSADASATLLLLNNKFNLKISRDQLLKYALQLGSDCPFFIINKPSHATGQGELLKPIDIDLSKYRMIIINPAIAIETRRAFSGITLSHNPKLLLEAALKKPIETWKHNVANDFEPFVFGEYPEIKDIKEKLYHLGALYASLSGSGSSVFGIFSSEIKIEFPTHYFYKWI